MTFTHLVETLGDGEYRSDIEQALVDLVGSVKATGKGGALTVKLSVKPAGKNHDVVLIEGDVSVKAPILDRGATIFYTTDKNELTRKDPKQLDLPNLRVVEMEAKEIKNVG